MNVAFQTVTVTILQVNHAPVAVDDVVWLTEDTPKIIYVLANDYDVDGDTLLVSRITQAPTHGTVVIDSNDALSVIYTPNPNYNGYENEADDYN